MPEPLEGYAKLPEDLLRELLEGADQVVSDVQALLGPALDNKEGLQAALRNLGFVRRFEELGTGSVCGVDGGYAVERTAAADLVLSVAVGVEGLGSETTEWGSTQYQWWANVRKHDQQSERLARGVMVAQELAVIADAPHTYRILDGSHLTLVIQLNSALTCFNPEIRAEARRVWKELDTLDALRSVVEDPEVLAMPKYDSSRVFTESLEQRTGLQLPGDDKHLMSLLLEAGEMTIPLRVPKDPWTKLHFDAGGEEDRAFAEALEDAIRPLKRREIYFSYVKPDDFSSAFRVEYKPDMMEDQFDSFCSTLANQITGPFVREPFPQYLADVMAKSVGLGLSALQSAVQLSLSREGRPDIAELLVRSYRTEGV
ncbi:DNA double-strand break repair nuclease NurA [Gemmatimonadota bacterium]